MADSERDEYEAAARSFARDKRPFWSVNPGEDHPWLTELASLLRQTAEKAVRLRLKDLLAESDERSAGYVEALSLVEQAKGVVATAEARARAAERELAASRSESEALRADLDSATLLYAQARAESEALRGRLEVATELVRHWRSSAVLWRSHDNYCTCHDCKRTAAFLASPSSGTREPTNKETTP